MNRHLYFEFEVAMNFSCQYISGSTGHIPKEVNFVPIYAIFTATANLSVMG